MENLVTVPLKAYGKKQGFTQIGASVRENVNSYPYITFFKGNVSENIYFSKNSSKRVSEGISVKDIFADIQVVESAECKDGINKTKLVMKQDVLEGMFD